MGGPWPLAGRELELARIGDALGVDGIGAVVLAGESGVGKTRLAREALAAAEGADLATGFVTATRAAAAIPLGALAPLLPVAPPGATHGVDVLHAAVRAIADRDDGRRLALAIDDAHLLDDLSATVVQHLVATSAASVIATVRTGEPTPDVIVDLWKDEAADRIDVGPLDLAAVEDLLTAVLRGTIEGATLRELWHVSEGNPLFLRELVMGALDAGFLREDGRLWRLVAGLRASPRLVELVEARMEGLSPDQRDALETVALAESVGVDPLSDAAGEEALGALERKGLLMVEVDGRRRRVRLAHPLHGEVLRERMPAIRRLAVQRTLADHLESVGARRREDVLQAAVWRLEAGGPTRADLLLEGARRALYPRNQQLAERLARAAIEAGAGPKANILLARALQGQMRGEEALAAIEALDEDRLSEEDLAEVMVTRAETLFFMFGRGEEAEALLRHAEAVLQDPDLRDDVTGFRASIHLFRNRPLDAIADAERVLARGGRPGRGLVGALLAGVPAWAITGQAEEAVARSDLFAELARAWEEELPFIFGQYQAGRFVALRFAGRLQEGAEASERGYEAAVARRDRYAHAAMAAARGQAELAIGRAGPAARWLHEAVSILRETDPDGYLPLSLGGLAQARALRGDVADADDLIAEAEAAPWQVLGMEIELARVWVAAARGDLPLARGLAQTAAEAARSSGQSSYETLLLHDVARLGDARAVVDRLRELAGVVQGTLVPVYAAHVSALVADDAAALDEVSVSFEALGALLLAAEAAAEAAASHRRAGDPRTATRSARRATMLAAACQGARTPALANARQTATLTAREREVALLAAHGVANRDIAAELSVSVRTVENHLQHAYEKLGVSSRRELAEALGESTPVLE